MFSALTSINVLKYLIPSCLAFMLGFYLAENVTTKVYSIQIEKLNTKHTVELSTLQKRLTELIEAQNTTATNLNTTSNVLDSKNTEVLGRSTSETTRALIKYKDRLVLVSQPCKLSDPSIEYIRDHVIGK